MPMAATPAVDTIKTLRRPYLWKKKDIWVIFLASPVTMLVYVFFRSDIEFHKNTAAPCSCQDSQDCQNCSHMVKMILKKTRHEAKQMYALLRGVFLLAGALLRGLTVLYNDTNLSEKYPMKSDPTIPPAKKEASPVPTKCSRSQTRSKEATRLWRLGTG